MSSSELAVQHFVVHQIFPMVALSFIWWVFILLIKAAVGDDPPEWVKVSSVLPMVISILVAFIESLYAIVWWMFI